MIDKIAMCLLAALVTAGAGWLLYTQATAKEVTYHEGDCLKMNLAEVEEWNNGLMAQVVKVGKRNYEVKYWLEFGWTQRTDTWPFSLQTVKVMCPTVIDDGAK